MRGLSPPLSLSHANQPDPPYASPLPTHPASPPPHLCSYNSGRTLDAFLEFLDGKLKADAGFARVEKLDPLARKFAAASR